MRALAVVVICLAAIAAPRPARADDAAALLAKHRAFVGWQLGDSAVRSMVLDGEIVETKRDGTTDVLDRMHGVRLGVANRTTYQSRKRGTSTSDGFTGRVYWSADENGFVRPRLGEAEKAAVSEDLVFNEAAGEFPATFRDAEELNGAPVDVLRVSPPIGDAIDLYVDPQSGAFRRAVIDPDGTYEQTIDILAYAEPVPGKHFISRWRFGRLDRTYDWTRFQLNAPVTNDDLHPPKQTAIWTFSGGEPIPVQLTDSRIFVNATVNGVSGRFILDTGSSFIALDQSFADRAHVKPIDAGNANGIGGSQRTSVIRIDSLGLGKSVLSNVIADSLDLSKLKADGLLGFDLLAGAIVNLDLGNDQMTLYDPAKMQVDKTQGVVATVDLSSGQPHVPMTVDGKIEVNAVMDTGDPYFVLYGHDLIYKYGVTMLRHAMIMGGVGSGYQIVRCGMLGEISMGAIVYQGPSACESGSFAGRNILIGLDFLKNFNFVFDYPEATIVLLPRKT